MRLLVHEYASGGGLAGQEVPASLGREGSAMLAAVLADLAALGRYRLVTTVDPRFPVAAPPDVEVVTLVPGGPATLASLMASADAVWLIAPETGGCLERLAARVERRGLVLFGSGSAAVRRAADMGALARRLARRGVPYPETAMVNAAGDARAALRGRGFPAVVKPARGAGCEGVTLARDAGELRRAVAAARAVSGGGPLIVQEYVEGTAASVSLLADGRRAAPLTVNAQALDLSPRAAYRGGQTPFDHPLAGRAMDVARRACEALPGLRGYVGVDVVLTDEDVVVIEVNPRLTTAYLGVRAAVDENVAGLAIAACGGTLPAAPRIRRRVRFSAAGRLSAGRSAGRTATRGSATRDLAATRHARAAVA